MPHATHVPSNAVLDIAHAWHHIADCQRQLDLAAARAHAGVNLGSPVATSPDFEVQTDDRGAQIVLQIVAHEAAPEAVRAWATPDLLLVRARRHDGRTAEQLIRLPATVDPESADIERTDERFVIAFERRTAVPRSLWPADA